ncbi:MAG TPA: BCCT family transporter [Methyloceanibacter sp.]|nr:BCCT family transporter [Methyloceanibacter sp.]
MEAGRDAGSAAPLAHCTIGVPTSAKLVVTAFVIVTVFWPTLANESFAAARDFISVYAGWFYGAVVSAALIMCVVLAIGPWGSVRLGADDEGPEFGWLSWTAMLFAAGMGIGLVFWSIAEPLTHYAGNPLISAWGPDPSSIVRARVAMEITFFHWGLMPWALYAIAGLIFAYFSFRKGEPLTVRSAMRPLIGDRVGRWPGKLADVVAIVATVFGLATSLGFGADQINAGLARLFGWQVSMEHKLLLVAVICGAAVLSVSSGLNRGIRLLSLANIWLAALILIVVLISAPIEPILRNFSIRLGDYLANLPWLTYKAAEDDTGWSASWTTFYWGWWISWTPFVGLFIARISRGRTVREFILGVLLVPTAITFVWLSIMGGAAISAARGGPAIIEIAKNTPALSLYAMIDFLQTGTFATIIAGAATLLVAIFFITSADSGTLVVTTMQCGGHTEPPILERVQWGIGMGAVAAALLVAGGLGALQAMTVAAALPFSVVLVALGVGFMTALHQDTIQQRKKRRARKSIRVS